MGVGAFANWSEIERYIALEAPVRPDPARHERYQRLFALYRETYEALKGIFPKLQRNGRE
jgi:xylulokinase